ncbi:hypothetical protein V8E53_000005 [Lactarius tabidus]
MCYRFLLIHTLPIEPTLSLDEPSSWLEFSHNKLGSMDLGLLEPQAGSGMLEWFRYSGQACSSRTPTSSMVMAAALLGGNNALSSSQTSSKNPGAYWPPEFYADLTSRVWITHRSHFHPIPDSDAGQSLLATALIHLHLGRGLCTADYATYVQILTSFFDSPSTLCPFRVHWMALAGKELGKETGNVQRFPDASLGISVVVDGQIFQTDVYSALHWLTQTPRPRKLSRWGDRAVVLFICVNPIYYETTHALYTFGGRPSSSYYFVGSQADNLFYLNHHHTCATIPLRQPMQTTTELSGSVSPHRSPTPSASSRTGSSTFSYPAASPSPLSKQLSTSSSSSRGAHVRWNSAGANRGRSVLLDKTPLSGLDPSMLIGFLCKTEADWIDIRRRVVELSKNHKTIFSIVNELLSWSDADNSLESMSDPEEDEDDMPDDKDCEAEDSSHDFLDAGEGVVIPDRLSLRAAFESGQSGSGGGTEDDPVDSTDLDDEEWVNPTPIPPTTPLEPAPPTFPPPIIAKTKSSSNAKSRKRKEACAPVPLPSSVTDGVQEDRPRRVP